MPEQTGELAISWSAAYHPEWDLRPEDYVEHGVVGWGRSRRLARATDPTAHLTAYLGVQHWTPARWGLVGEPRTSFFLSLFLGGRTVALRTFPTLPAALAALYDFHMHLTYLGEPGHNGANG